MKAIVVWAAGLVAATAFAAEGDQERTVNGLNRTHLADTAVCLGRSTMFVGYSILAGGDKDGDRAGLKEKALAANAALPERLRDPPETVRADVEALYANPPTSLPGLGARRMEQCVQRQAIPLEPSRVGRCYELVGFLNAMRATMGKNQTAESFAELWGKQIARSPQELEKLRPLLIEQYGKGAMAPREELIAYLGCAMKRPADAGAERPADEAADGKPEPANRWLERWKQ
ncbi:hypothetical protein [Lysobacter silvisoli]|uniref:Uncharacterized protein n=1 Tax=Lysobacter silvisoli TaxID=2293254 RepID=A0A371JYU2_9GAMM|nr:hypothetical protein [Lysobacter silvisoli]RDZ26792.1 hypothetical protein DX914_17640 [Lysobacter silvisoli]